MWIVIDKLSTEQSSDAKGEGQTYVAFSAWPDEASRDKGNTPYQSDLLISAGLLPETVTRYVKDELGNLLLRRGGFWTEIEYAFEVKLFHLGTRRTHPNADLATETVNVDLAQELKDKHILPALERADAAGLLTGSRKNSGVREKEQPVPEDKAEKSELKGLVGVGFELLLAREKEVKAVKDKSK